MTDRNAPKYAKYINFSANKLFYTSPINFGGLPHVITTSGTIRKFTLEDNCANYHHRYRSHRRRRRWSRTAIAAAEANPDLEVALISKVYPIRSHTVAAEGGSAAVIKDEDSLDNHFNNTVGGGDWLCEQDVVEYFVENATR